MKYSQKIGRLHSLFLRPQSKCRSVRLRLPSDLHHILHTSHATGKIHNNPRMAGHNTDTHTTSFRYTGLVISKINIIIGWASQKNEFSEPVKHQLSTHLKKERKKNFIRVGHISYVSLVLSLTHHYSIRGQVKKMAFPPKHLFSLSAWTTKDLDLADFWRTRLTG